MTHLPIWFIHQLQPEVCDQMVAEFSKLPKRTATMGIDGDVSNSTFRNTDVGFVEKNNHFEDLLKQVALGGNKQCKWDYVVDGNEAIQYAQYGVGQHYHWHTDTFTLSGKEIERKLTVVCLLNDPSEFEGGEFQIRLYQDYVAPLQKGSVIAFPSILEHRVTPVTKGVRKSATMWLSGPRFR
jgi:PKHD-type hydroxylase